MSIFKMGDKVYKFGINRDNEFSFEEGTILSFGDRVKIRWESMSGGNVTVGYEKLELLHPTVYAATWDFMGRLVDCHKSKIQRLLTFAESVKDKYEK